VRLRCTYCSWLRLPTRFFPFHWQEWLPWPVTVLLCAKGVGMAAGALLGLETGILMSVLVVIWTIIVTSVDHHEFAFALFFMPFLICILRVLGAWATAFFVRRSA
jgi:hypothetical protein